MKNVIIYQTFIDKPKTAYTWTEEMVFAYLRAQVDNSLRLGWNINDIIICTNLDFSYKDVVIIKLDDICYYNKFFNKQYGIAELLSKKLIDDIFWFHDFDDWQLNKFEFPVFNGDIGMCKYLDDSQWNTGSIFIKPSSLDIWLLIVEFMKLNASIETIHQWGDENAFNYIYNSYNEIHSRLSKLNNTYNIGVTQFEQRYAMATLPISVAGFKPDYKGYDFFLDRNLIPIELQEIFKTHKII